MVGMPSTVKVGPHVYSILRLPKKQMEGDLGSCDFTTLTIRVRSGLRKSKSREILLHEVLHATTHPSVCDEKPMLDEEFVTAVSPVLLQVLQENPPFVEYLTSN